MAKNKFFTNTYITSSGRRNYLSADTLEDPLFTSFTFDIDYITSPLFYTINYSDYGYPTSKGMPVKIENALKSMYGAMASKDQGYDILSAMSAVFVGEEKLGFGLQQNVYMDMPLYGATEYIYMVDKWNGISDQNDATNDTSNIFAVSGGNPNAANGSKLGDSVKNLVTERDAEFAQMKKKQEDERVNNCINIMNETRGNHQKNKEDMDTLKGEYDNFRVIVDGIEVENSGDVGGSDGSKSNGLTEEQLENKIKEFKKFSEDLKYFKKSIVDWVNSVIMEKQSAATLLYKDNKCIQKIESYKDLSSSDDAKKTLYYDELKKLDSNFVKTKLLGDDGSFIIGFNQIFDELVTFTGDAKNAYKTGIEDNQKSFLLDTTIGDNKSSVRTKTLLEKFGEKFKEFGLYDGNESTFKCKIFAVETKEQPDWLKKMQSGFIDFTKSCVELAKLEDGYKEITNGNSICDDWSAKSKTLMSYQCDESSSFTDFTSDKIKKNEELLSKCETALKDVRTKLYGSIDGEPCDESNPTPDSIYGKYMKSKDKYENDEYSQAEKTYQIASEGVDELNNMLVDYNGNTDVVNNGGFGNSDDIDNSVGSGNSDGAEKPDDSGESDKNDKPSKPSGSDNSNDIDRPNIPGGYGGSEGSDGSDYSNGSKNSSDSQNGGAPTENGEEKKLTPPELAPRTVLDMLGFISGMKKMTTDYPYIIQGVTGLDAAYNKHYGIKDPYLGSGDDKITLTCFDSLDLRVSSMFNRYFNAVYDRQYRRERVPINLRRFNCMLYVHDVRNFVNKLRGDSIPNRILELTDMYYSVIEFRFYDCEIVPEETGNIFNDISNESPSEMKKTNFTFTYGNCVVNFVPPSKVAEHNVVKNNNKSQG